MPSVQMFRDIYKDRFFYQLYYQEPGVAETELEADVPTGAAQSLSQLRTRFRRPCCV
jgi:hypothetical protein